jgi:pimeloyl-ACP methyl ester carboxylesterase
MKTTKFLFPCVLIILCSLLTSCSKNDEINEPRVTIPLDNLSSGSGSFSFTYDVISYTKTLDVYYYIPTAKTTSTPILFVFHGTDRNAKDYRDAMVAKAELLGFIVIVPEFSDQDFPGGDTYNLGNVFVDGDNPSSGTLRPENEWTFSIIEPLFDFLKTQIENSTLQYHVFGHSAGGQFAHRFLLFKPNARVDKTVVSASGWYTFPNTSINFPYGLSQSPLLGMSIPYFLSKKVYIQVGEYDDDPNDSGLRHNEYADAQGLNRKDRAISFFQFCQQLSVPTSFNWSFHFIENADHDYIKASEKAATLLFN